MRTCIPLAVLLALFAPWLQVQPYAPGLERAPTPGPTRPDERPNPAAASSAPSTDAAGNKPAESGGRAPDPPRAKEIDLKTELAPFDGCFVLLDVANQELLRYNPKRCAERFSPASTFKIPNSLIGLELGIIPDADHRIAWDGTQHLRKELNRDHTLRTAIRDSVLWYYQELARRAGTQHMRDWVQRLNYGNRNTGAAVDRFWIDGALKISADEQVAWLDRLRRNTLPVSARSRDILLDIMTLADHNAVLLRGKTGTVGRGDAAVLGWFVGIVRRGEREYVFALNLAAEKDALGPTARERAVRILRQLGALPADWEIR